MKKATKFSLVSISIAIVLVLIWNPTRADLSGLVEFI